MALLHWNAEPSLWLTHDILGSEVEQFQSRIAVSALKHVGLQVAELISQLLSALVPADARDSSAAVLELRAGAGGAEAALFTADLLRMYQQYAQQRGWAWQV